MHNAQTEKMVHLGLSSFLRAEAEDMLPFTLPLWLGGLVWLLATKAFRFLGLAFLFVWAVVVFGNGKPYYVAPAFPLLYAAGATLAERLLVRAPYRALVVGVLVLGGAIAAPLAVPILDPPAYVRYAAALGAKDVPDEKHDMGPLPQHFADQFGWEAMTRKVASAYASLSPEEREHVVIYTRNYGEAGAVDFFAKRLGLPPAASGHNSYFLWGPPARSGDVLIAIGGSPQELEETYATVVQVDATDERYAMPYENHRPIYICRGLKRPLRDVWPSMKAYI
jgi:hypothetical protein